jgi:hypothetical protein
MSPLRTNDLDLDPSAADHRRELLALSAQFAAREQELLRERDRLLKTIDELHHRLHRAESIGVHSVRVA